MNKVYLNGSFMDEDEAVVPVGDSGFLYGDGLFETMRAYGGRVFRLGEHLRRLKASADVFHITLREPVGELEAIVTELLDVNDLTEARVRITLTRGIHGENLWLDTGEHITLFISAREYHGYPRELYARGMKVIVGDTVRHSHSLIGRHKTLNYLENLLARDAAKTTGYDEVVFLGENGCVTECSTSNIFMVCNGELCTPGTEMNILPGITRSVVMELARWSGRKVLERKWHLKDLRQADEVFLTNSLMEVMPVCEAAEAQIGGGLPGEVTTELAADYRRAVEKECRENGQGA